jgi:uncharacterized protein YkwD
MADHNYFNFTWSDGSNTQQRLRRAGYIFFGETISTDSGTPNVVVDKWMRNEKMRNDILSCHYADVGVGIALRQDVPFWTLVLGRESLNSKTNCNSNSCLRHDIV